MASEKHNILFHIAVANEFAISVGSPRIPGRISAKHAVASLYLAKNRLRKPSKSLPCKVSHGMCYLYFYCYFSFMFDLSRTHRNSFFQYKGYGKSRSSICNRETRNQEKSKEGKEMARKSR